MVIEITLLASFLAIALVCYMSTGSSWASEELNGKGKNGTREYRTGALAKRDRAYRAEVLKELSENQLEIRKLFSKFDVNSISRRTQTCDLENLLDIYHGLKSTIEGRKRL